MADSALQPPASDPSPKRRSALVRREYRRETNEPHFDCPLCVEQFEFIRTIGTGSYSRVILARHIPTGQSMALKTLSKVDVINSGQVSRIFYEKSILRLLASPFVVGFRGSFQDEKHLYMALEYVNGGELFKVMVDNDRLSEAQSLFYTAEIAAALMDLHGINCVYRDLKPENILISRSGHIKLADFGSAKIIPLHSRTFTLCGTPEYLAPEVIDRCGHSISSDWWQLGILLFEMLAAYPPFSDQSPFRLYEKILLSRIEYPKFFSHRLITFLSGLLTKNPKDRLTDKEVETHPFFSSINWTDVRNRELTPPLLPSVSSSFDCSNFQTYEEEGDLDTPTAEWNRAFESF